MHQTRQQSLYEVQGKVKDSGTKYFYGNCEKCGRPTASLKAVQNVCDDCSVTYEVYANEQLTDDEIDALDKAVELVKQANEKAGAQTTLGTVRKLSVMDDLKVEAEADGAEYMDNQFTEQNAIRDGVSSPGWWEAQPERRL